MLHIVTAITLLLAVYIQYIEGVERVIVVSEPGISDAIISDDEDIPVSSVTDAASGSHVFIDSLRFCCVDGNCTCPSLPAVLANLTSNTLINITTDVVLFSIISLTDLANITIIGHNNPTINCISSGGLHFSSCHNCIIQGIIWDKCGANVIIENANISHPVLQLINSSNITIKNCLFQHSIGQAIAISQMTGDVNISHCNFLSNNYYEGHGSAIYYSSNDISTSSLIFMITSSNFKHNKGAKSLIYLHQSLASESVRSCEYLYLQNSNFYHNKEVPIYLSNQNLYISGNIEFNGNVAENGGGIYISDHSNVTIHNSATVKFMHNRANRNGGAIFLTNHSSIVFKEHNILQQCYDDKLYYIGEDQYLERSLIIAFYNNTANKFGGEIYAHNSKITFSDTADVKFDGRCCRRHYFGRSLVHISNQSVMIFEGNSRVTFNNYFTKFNDSQDDNPKQVVVYIAHSSIIKFEGNSTINFTDTNADGVMYVYSYCTITFEENSIVNFTNINGYGEGGAMYIYSYSTITFEGNSTVNFIDISVYGDGGAMYIHSYSTITFEGNSTVNFIDISYYSDGRVMYIYSYSNITFEGNSTVNFIGISVLHGDGGAMYIFSYSTITFEGNSTVNFIDISVYGNSNNGGVMFIYSYSTITFEGNSIVNFIDNFAGSNGGVMHIVEYSTITFEGNSTVIFADNQVNGYGEVMFIDGTCTITFEGKSTVNFTDNGADLTASYGGVMYIGEHGCSRIRFKGNSIVNFINNHARNSNGGVMYISDCTVKFQENSTVNFIDNYAKLDNGGVMYIDDCSLVTFEGNSTVNFIHNYAKGNGGVIYIDYFSAINFKGNCTVSFIDNYAGGNGGVMYVVDHTSTITFEGNSTVNFTDNYAYGNGGVMWIHSSSITFKGYSTVNFTNNYAYGYGGVMYMYIGIVIDHDTIKFQGDSTVDFINNQCYANGGVMYINDDKSPLNSNFNDFHIIIFQGNSAVTFTNNHAYGNGGVMYIDYVSELVTATFQGNCTVNFLNNTADNNGGVIYIWDYSNIIFEENSTVNFTDNFANGNGGVIYFKEFSSIKFQGNSTATFHHNRADSNGGVMHINHNSNFWLKGRARIVFSNNTAYLGGSVYMKFSSFIIDKNSFVAFVNNTALQDGGAIYLRDQSELLDYSNITFCNNSASDYGGAIYVLYNKQTSIDFYHLAYCKGNTAKQTQSSVYINVDKSCDKDCLFNSATYKNNVPVTTSPNRLVLYNPAKCINGNKTDCDTYYMTNIMLGQDITFDACLLDYYDQPTKAAAEFLITGMNHQDYSISSSKYISISCNHTIQGITVIGNLQSNNTHNYSINISLFVTRLSESKGISVNLIVELSHCHPGFWYSPANESRQCECYNTGDIISCSGSNSTIKRGYWYGSVTGTPTVATCPNDYCNFTCCEITNGIYHLSPVRANQCRPHRSGTACSSCEEGYTLSFDSPECVEIKDCTVGLVLVTTLSLLYWIVVVIAVYVMMYSKVSFGSLYAIVYYYSIIDILLSRVVFISNKLYTTVAIMSSLAKLTPQFLGRLCLVRNMSGIDQQFIHYVHPVVVFFTLIMISMLARRSRRVSLFVSKGIISFICFLLLLSYTSVASTSLLLMRPLTFVGIAKVYTYLSPDIEYFHGRHIAYAIVALILMITIVICYPLLLLLEPFLNSKINFVKIKPLLDQFQGCYKDKYRYFAGYYMICRLVIILLVIVKISDDFTTQYLLISSCALIQLIHVLVRPYASTINNIFDGIILQLIVIISVLPVIEFVDQYDEIFVTVIIYVLVILPLISFIAIKVWINKNIIQIASYKCKNMFISCYYNEVATDDPQESVEIRQFSVIVDENMRRNAIVVDV